MSQPILLDLEAPIKICGEYIYIYVYVYIYPAAALYLAEGRHAIYGIVTDDRATMRLSRRQVIYTVNTMIF